MAASLAALLLAALCACVPKLEKPQLSIAAISLEHGSLREQHLRAHMHVRNPNRHALRVQRLDYTLEVGGDELAHGASTAAFTVPALGETEFDMSMTTDLAGALLRLLGSRGQPLEYHLVGKVTLAEGLALTIPFDERGTFSFH